jgi:hypothetical protein
VARRRSDPIDSAATDRCINEFREKRIEYFYSLLNFSSESNLVLDIEITLKLMCERCERGAR